jgi:hypothetical protein
VSPSEVPLPLRRQGPAAWSPLPPTNPSEVKSKAITDSRLRVAIVGRLTFEESAEILETPTSEAGLCPPKALLLVARSDWPPAAPRRRGCQSGIANDRSVGKTARSFVAGAGNSTARRDP